MSEKYKKTKTTVYLSSTTIDKLDSLKIMEDTNCSRGEIIEKAVDFYKSHIDLKQDIDYIAPVLKAVIDGSMNTYFNRLNRNIYKESVELNMLTRCVGKMFNIDEETYNKLRRLSVEEVSHNKGTISLLDAQD